MPDSFTTFYSSDMLAAMQMLSRLRNEARTLRPAVSAELTAAFVGLESDLNKLSRASAVSATARIREKIRQTAKRPDTDHPTHLIDAIKCEPLPLGGVAVGVLSELNKLQNPETGGVYWRAQEEGSVAVGNKMTGRVLYGRFVGAGYSEQPQARYSGAVGAPGAEFMFGDLSGDPPGFGTIQHEIQPRHFLRDGALEAFALYSEQVRQMSRQYAKRVEALAVVAVA